MDNEVEGVQIGIYSYEIFGKPIFRFGVQVGAFFFLHRGCKYCILQKKIDVFIKNLCHTNTIDCIKY